MLLQFTVENFLSFDAPTHFSMRAGKDKDLPHHVMGNKIPAVKGAAIYGANAAGKSNLIQAMIFARDLIVKGRSLGQSIPVRPFGQISSAVRPSGFHWEFILDGKVWSYGFDVTNRAIVEEYLFARDTSGGREKKWFERKTDENGLVEISFGEALRGSAKGRLAQRLSLITQNLRAEQPFLTHAVENNIVELKPLWRWFETMYIIRPEGAAFDDLLYNSVRLDQFLSFASQLLSFADTGIIELKTDRKPFQIEEAKADLAGHDFYDLMNDIEILKNGQMINYGNELTPRSVFRDNEGELWLLRFKTLHEEGMIFPLEHESEGTQRLLHLAPVLYYMQRFSSVFIIDELDRRLHTLLVQEFVKMALSEQSQGQLIFTTHDTNLLDSWLLRRDEIHFVQKDQGRSTLSRLSDWNVRKDLDYEKAYLRGSFEGRPFFKFTPDLQGLTISNEATPPSEAELKAQLTEAA